MPIIQSILDNDLYTFTVGQAVMEHFYDARVKYKFKDRNGTKYTQEFLELLKSEINAMSKLALANKELEHLRVNCPFLKPQYLDYLKNYRFNPLEITASLDEEDCLVIDIDGTWHSTIFWEVPLLALISECYFKTIDTNWNYDNQQEKATKKRMALGENNVYYADFGTRRRRSFKNQSDFVDFCKFDKHFVGTSNVYLSMIYKIKCIGTMSHQWIMGISALESLRHANKFAMNKWMETYDGSLGIVLPDTFGTDAFFKDFQGILPKTFDGIRHDSGDAIVFGKKVIKHYNSLNINPMSKTIVFSDGLDYQTAIAIKKEFEGKINTSFGIGTHFTNDFNNSKALNIVIKLSECNGIPVVKLSDVAGKAIGDSDALQVAQWTFNKTPLTIIA